MTEAQNRAANVRAWVYRGVVGTAPLVAAYGLVDASTVALWIGAIGTWLGVGLAASNSTTKNGRDKPLP